MVPEHFIKDEAFASNIVRKYLNSKKKDGWRYEEEYELKSGWARLDYLVKAPYEGGHIFFGIECKKALSRYTSWSDLAKYFEQMVAYQTRPDVSYPIFLAPIVEDENINNFYKKYPSYTNLNNIQVFDRLAGRLNVGVMYMSRTKGNWGATLRLRDGTYYSDHRGFRKDRLKISVTKNSHITRVPQKIWGQEYNYG
jgi:hypothetical protein